MRDLHFYLICRTQCFTHKNNAVSLTKMQLANYMEEPRKSLEFLSKPVSLIKSAKDHEVASLIIMKHTHFKHYCILYRTVQ